MTIEFMIVAGLLVALSTLLLLWPMIRQSAASNRDRRDLNISLHRDRLKELEREYQTGVIDHSQYASAKEELEDSLLSDVDAEDRAETRDDGRGRGRLVLIAAALVVPGIALTLQSQMQQTAPSAQQMAGTSSAIQSDDPTSAEINRLVTDLSQRLEENPDNPDGWIMLAQTYQYLGMPTRAIDAYENAYRYREDDADLIMEYADALIAQANGEVTRRAAALADAALELEPGHLGALWFAGVGHYQAEEFERAAARWRQLLEHLPDNSEAAAQVARAIDSAASFAGVDVHDPAEHAAATDNLTVIDVDLRLDEALASELTGEEMVLIYARATEGPGMPLAVVRKSVSELPMGIRLDASSSMLAGLSIDSVANVEVVARVSRSGDASPRSGDLEGASGPLTTGGALAISLAIDRRIP